MDGPPTLPTAELEMWLAGVHTSDGATNFFESPTSVTMSTSEAAVLRDPVWVAERHEDDWTATVGSDQAVIEECCAGGATILSQMNPESFTMPEGTRVVCIKTQHLNNLHIAMQRATWVTGDKVGEKINRVFEENNPEAGEKVLLIFSINRQRAFCALAEMKGPWVKGDDYLPGWQEAAGSFNIVGSIPVTFTHVKNISNDHFEHVHHENPNQPITNMWNGMHFQLEKGREVVKLFHEKAHFTNVLCRDKRKPYTPFDVVTSAQEIDPTVPRKYTAPHRIVGRARGMHVLQTISNWRHNDEHTPTRTQQAKLIECKPQGPFRTPTPTQPRFMKRDHGPTPLHLRTPTFPPLASPSPRPGQVVKCVADENGNYIPIGPFEVSPGVPTATPRVQSAHNPKLFGYARNEETESSPHPQLGAQHGNEPRYERRGTQAHSSGAQQYPPSLQRDSLKPLFLTAEGSLPSPQHPCEIAAQDMSGQSTSTKSGQTTSTDLLLRAATKANYFVPNHLQLHELETADTSALLAGRVDSTAPNPYHIAREAYGKNERLLSYEAMRRQAQSNANDSASSTLFPEYKDWASTSEIEKLRIAPVSPFTDSDPFIADSISKKALSPTTKAFKASVNRELRTLRQGQRAMPTPSKFKSKKPPAFNPDLAHEKSVHAVGRGGSMDGGVPIPSGAMQPETRADDSKAGLESNELLSTGKSHRRGLSSLSGLGQLPCSKIPAMVSAGQYAPDDRNASLAAAPKASEPSEATSNKQTAFSAYQPNDKRATRGGRIKGKSPSGFTA